MRFPETLWTPLDDAMAALGDPFLVLTGRLGAYEATVSQSASVAGKGRGPTRAQAIRAALNDLAEKHQPHTESEDP